MTKTTKTDDLTVRALLELERRRKADPMAFYEPASDKIADFHACTSNMRALFGANRSSKTESALQEVLWHLRGNHPFQEVPKPPVYWRIVVVDYNQVEKVILEKIRRMLPASLMVNGRWEKSYNSRSHILTLANGSKVDLMTHDQDLLAFEGAARHGTLFDEEPPEDIYVSCIMRHVDYGGKTIMAMTPLQGLTWVYNRIYLRGFSDPTVHTWTLSIYENRFLSQEQINEIENLVVDETERDIRLFGKFRSRTGLVFKPFDPQIHVYNPTNPWYEEWWDSNYPPPYWLHIIGIDPGWGHPTGVLWMAMNPDNEEKYFYREHKEAEMLPEDHAELIKIYNQEMGVINPVYVIDSQAKATDQKGGSILNEYQNNGIYPRLGTKKLHEGNIALARAMKVMFDRRNNPHTEFHVSNECPQFIEEIGSYQRAKPTAMNAGDRYVDKMNDLISAARYANWEANRMDMVGWIEERFKNMMDKKRKYPSGRIPEPHVRKGFSRTGY